LTPIPTAGPAEVSRKVRLQNIRDFTVQVRRAGTDEIVGTGVVVSNDGKIVTCAHVLMAAGVNPRTGRPVPGTWEIILGSLRRPDAEASADAADGEVGVYFPQARGGERKDRRAKLVACFSEHDDDVVLLQLIDGPPPLGPEQIAVLGVASASEGNPFRSYGYRRLDKYKAGRANGTIMGTVERPEGRAALREALRARSDELCQRIRSGDADLGPFRDAAINHLRRTVRDKLLVSNPRWIGLER